MMIEMFINVYLPRFFDWVIETSIMASILVGLILCVKTLLRNKLPPRWQYLLWMILIVRLLLPWSPDSSYSIYSILSYSNENSVTFQQAHVILSPSKERKQESTDIGDTKIVTKEDTYVSGSTQIAEESKKQTQNNEAFSFYSIIIYIWLAGVVILSFTTIILNRSLLLYIKKQPAIVDERIVQIFENCKKSMSVQQDISLLLSGKISSPTVFGFIRPRVLLSSVHMKVLDEQQLRYIFHHELAHIKRRDVGVNWLMHGLLILNWFNPILWYAYSCMREDQELACDALALTFIDSEEQIAYGHTIITLLEHYTSYYQMPSLANLSRNKRTLKRRIRMIKNFQKKSYRWSAFGVVVVVTLSSISLLNAKADISEKQKKEQIEEKNDINETKKEPEVPIQQIVEKIVGTKEQALEELKIPEDTYEGILEHITVARNILTKEEFDKFVRLNEEFYALEKKRMNFGPLSQDDQNKSEKISEAQWPLQEKIREHFSFTREEAQKLVDFPIKDPTYIVEGYQLQVKTIRSSITLGKPNPTIFSQYGKDRDRYTIYQSALPEKHEDLFYTSISDKDKIENYELEGAQFSFAKTKNNENAMKMIVPAKGKESAYQVEIYAGAFSLNKNELEKIMISFLK